MYSRQNWVNGPATSSPINATRLSHMEFGIEAASAWVNVKGDPYNATGNGSTNDTSAIAAALAAAQAANCPLYFPVGTYLTSDIVDNTNIDWVGDGPAFTVIKARSGSSTLLTVSGNANKRMSGFALDGAGISNTCLNSSWATTGPSLRNDFRDIYMRGYLTIGWIGDNNNDAKLSHITVENNASTPDSALAGRFHAPGGSIAFDNCVFTLPIQLSCQTATIRDGYNFGVVFDDAGWNTVSVHNGYMYPNPVTHNNFDITTGIAVRTLSLFGTQVENNNNDGFIVGGVGEVQNVNAVGGHIFGLTGTTPSPKIAANTLSASALFGLIHLSGVFVENLNLANPTHIVVSTQNINYQGNYQSNMYLRNDVGGDALTISGRLATIASTTGAAGIQLPHGVAPTSPVNGDMWTTTAGLFVRINGVTKTVTLT